MQNAARDGMMRNLAEAVSIVCSDNDKICPLPGSNLDQVRVGAGPPFLEAKLDPIGGQECSNPASEISSFGVFELGQQRRGGGRCTRAWSSIIDMRFDIGYDEIATAQTPKPSDPYDGCI